MRTRERKTALRGVDEGRIVLTVLLIVFVTLKLVGVVDWSWWLVLAPFWVPALLAAGAVALAVARGRR